MPENNDERLNKKYEIQFMSFIQGLAASAMQQMGKIMNPVSGEVEKNLEGARITIDMIEMLQAKTEGNRSDQESSILKELLTNLRLNYVDELKAEQEKPQPAKEQPESEKAKAEQQQSAKEDSDKKSD